MNPNGMLRRWREERTDLSQRQAASRLPVAVGTMNRYEGAGNVPFEMVQRLDDLYDARGMLTQFVRAAAVPEAYDARSRWVHNFLGESREVWAWVRLDVPSSAPFVVTAHWGAFEATIGSEEVDAEPDGFIITAPRSVDLPAVFMRLDPPGWVGFGDGAPPTDLGIPVVSALAHLRRFPGREWATGMIGRQLRRVLGPLTEEHPLDLRGLGELSHVALDLLTATDQHSTQDVDVVLEPAPSIGGKAIRRARKAHRWSQEHLASEAASTGGLGAVNQDQVSRIERNQNVSIPFLRSVIDTILQGDGTLCCDEVSQSVDGTWTFPSAYVGPVWVEMATREAAEVVLRWREWRKTLRVQGPAVVTFRHTGGDDRLEIVGPAALVIRAGTGWRDDATDVNDDWVLDSPAAAQALWARSERMILDLIGWRNWNWRH